MVAAEADALADLPEGVRRAQFALAAPSRLAVINCLMESPSTFAEMSEIIPVSSTALRSALDELNVLGWVTDDSPAGRQRKTRTAVFTADRQRVLRDLAELMLMLAH